VYEERIYKLSVNCAKEAVKRNVKVFVQFSTGDIYESDGVSVSFLLIVFQRSVLDHVQGMHSTGKRRP